MTVEEVTPAMIEAGRKAALFDVVENYDTFLTRIYEAMRQAAPTQQELGERA